MNIVVLSVGTDLLIMLACIDQEKVKGKWRNILAHE